MSSEQMHVAVRSEILWITDDFGDRGVDWKLTLDLILYKHGVRVWSEHSGARYVSLAGHGE
jgi:hypothetical protein